MKDLGATKKILDIEVHKDGKMVSYVVFNDEIQYGLCETGK
jgi:hypothetical protein